jgi:hypothetical protein
MVGPCPVDIYSVVSPMDMFTIVWAAATQKGVVACLPNTLIQEDKRERSANNNE